MENTTPGNASRNVLEATLKGKKYTFLEPGLDELSLFESHIKSKRLEMYLDAAKNVPADEKQEMIQTLLKTSLDENAIDAELTTLEGVRYMLFLCLRKNEGVELDSMSELIDLSNLSEATAILDGIGAEEVNPPPAETEKAADT